MKDSMGKEEIKMNVKSGVEDAQEVGSQKAPDGDTTKGTGGAAAGKSFSVVSYILLALFVLLMVMFVVEMLKFRQISSEIKDLKKDMTEKLARMKEELITETRKGHGQLEQGQRRIDGRILGLNDQMRKWHGELRAQIADMKNNCRPRFECPLQWTLFDQKCYYFSPNTENWTSSQMFCSSQMANLVVIDRSDKQAFIKNEIKAPPYWIGLRNSSSDRAWLWVDGTDYPSSEKEKVKKSRLYFLRRLASFNVCKQLLQMFYQTVVASAFFYATACWGGSIKKKDASRNPGSILVLVL